MKECPECLGTGEIEVDIPVVDYMNGGYIRTEIEDCPRCDGSGEVEDDEEDNDEISLG